MGKTALVTGPGSLFTTLEVNAVGVANTVDAYADVLRLEVADRSVEVGVACFGVVDRELLRTGLASPPAASIARRARLLLAHT